MKPVIVIPAYNEARTIGDLARRTRRFCEDVVVVDDGSDDGTAQCVGELEVELLRHDQNRGKAAALATGFARALERGADVVLTLDGDGQHRPEDIPRLLAAARRYPDRLIIGARLLRREGYPRARRFANAFADFWIGWASGQQIADSQSGQRVYPAALLRRNSTLQTRASRFTFESEILIRAAREGITTVAVPIFATYDAAGRPSHFRPVRDIVRIVVMVAGYLLRSGMNPRGLWRSIRVRSHTLNVPDLDSSVSDEPPVRRQDVARIDV
jgi:glycosyltransferase involved in cell wall biosynthesis